MIALFLTTMALTASFDAAVQGGRWKEVALDAAFPFDGARYEGGNVHDPSVARFGSTYLLVHTSGDSFSPISTSKDMLTWEHHGPIFKEAPEWLKTAIPQHRSVWAPAPVVIGKTLRVYYCASEKFGSNTSYIGVAECANFDPKRPTEGWVDKGVIVQSKAESSNFNAIDPDVLIGPDGRHWMVYGSYWSGMYQVELNPTTGLLKDPKKVPLHVASNTTDRGNPLEAPAMLYANGYYYLFVTYGLAAQGIRSTYRMECGRSTSPTGPFLGYDGKPMTEGGSTSLLKSSFPMFGPGGGNFFRGEDDDLYMAYHYYDGRRHWHGDIWGAPTMHVRHMVMGEDGWPLPGLPVGVRLQAGSVEGEWTLQADFANTASLTLRKDGSAKVNDLTGKWTRKGQDLVIRWKRTDGTDGEFVDTLKLHESNQFFVGRNQFGAVVRGVKRDAKTAR